MVAEISGATLDVEGGTLLLGCQTTQGQPIGQVVLFRLTAVFVAPHTTSVSGWMMVGDDEVSHVGVGMMEH